VRTQLPGPGMSPSALRAGARRDGTVFNFPSVLSSPGVTPFLAAGFAFRPVDGGEDYQRPGHPDERCQQYQGNANLGAHGSILGSARPHGASLIHKFCSSREQAEAVYR